MFSIFPLKFDKGSRNVLLWIVLNLRGAHLEYSTGVGLKQFTG